MIGLGPSSLSGLGFLPSGKAEHEVLGLRHRMAK